MSVSVVPATFPLCRAAIFQGRGFVSFYFFCIWNILGSTLEDIRLGIRTGVSGRSMALLTHSLRRSLRALQALQYLTINARDDKCFYSGFTQLASSAQSFRFLYRFQETNAALCIQAPSPPPTLMATPQNTMGSTRVR